MVAKTDARIQACGELDEFGAILGLMLQQSVGPELERSLRRIQNDCFDLGSDLACPVGSAKEEHIPRIQASQVAWLEGEIDAANEGLEPLRSFILAGGSPLAAWLHLARCVALSAVPALSATASIPRRCAT